MREAEYYISKDSCGKEYKTKTTTICGFDEIKKEIEENECLHDWSLEYVAYDGTTGQITAKSCSRPTLVRWIVEVEMVKGDNVTLTFDGVGIIITAKKLR